VANTKSPQQLSHVVGAKNVAHQAFPFTLHELAIRARHNTRRILTAVLQHSERIVNIGGDIPLSDQPYQSTHIASPSLEHVA
jgi:hypothetical protein